MNDISYLTDFYDEKIEQIKKLDAPLNFVFYTDPHNRLSEWDCPKHPDYAPTDFESAEKILTKANKKQNQSTVDQMKYEIAGEFGVNLGPDASARENGQVGGEITKRLVSLAKNNMKEE